MAETNGVKASAESEYQARVAALREKRKPKAEADAEARRQRDLKELDDVYAALDAIDGNDGSDETRPPNLLKIPGAPVELVGHCVFDRPSSSAVKRYKMVVFKGHSIAAERGSLDARVEANMKLAVSCLKYPDVDRFTKLCEVIADIPDAAHKLCRRLSEAGAQDDAKE